MVKAAKDAAATAANGGNTEIGKVVKVNAAAKGGEETSVNGIASGIKGIVEAAEKAGKEGKLESEEVAGAGDGNEDAGKLFATKKANDGGGEAKDAEKAATAVSAVSGKQILKAIVDAAAKGDGEKKGVEDVKDAKNPIAAAIGSTGENKNAAAFDKDGMKKNDQIAAAIVLRGMAKDGEFALKNNANNAEKGLKSTVESAVNKTVSGWLEEMVKAAQTAATAANGDNTEIGKVVKVKADAAAKGGDATSVNGIASGIKGIVTAAEKAGEEGKLESEAAAAGDGGEANAEAGKLFATKKKDAADGGGAGDAEKAAAAVSAVSGKQILKAIVDAAAKGDGEKKGVADVKDATNPIEAAIGSTKDNKAAAAFNKDGMKKNDQIAAAIVLRGMAKDGEFALKDDANNAKAGLKSTVESAVNKTVSGWLEEMAKAAQDAATGAAGGGNEAAGKLFATKKNDDNGGAAAAVSAVSGKQILKAIVDAAGKAGEEGKGVEDVKDATNPIAAAIGSTDDKAAAAFNNNGMKKNDQIAAAIVLRGMAKDGEFALKNDAAKAEKGLKSTVESAVNKTVVVV